jgi:hypothetical protein
MPSRIPSGEGPFEFTAKLVKKDVFFGVDVPSAVSRAIGVRGFVPVIGTANRAPLRTSLSPSGAGRHHLLLNREVRAAAGAELGDRVTIALDVDVDPPRFAIGEDVADALREEGVLADFEGMARGRRNQLVQWLDQAVHERTRAKRIARLVEVALAVREPRPDRDAR